MNFKVQKLIDWEASVRAENATRYLIEGFIAADSHTMLSGHPKGLGKKTLLAMIQALALSSGKSIEGFKVRAQKPVLYCYHEGGRPATQARIQMLRQGHGISEADTKDTFFFLHRSMMDLRDKNETKQLAQYCKDREIGLVVLDTLAKSMLGDEDSAENMGRVVRGVEEIRTFGSSVLMLHHLKKAQSALQGGSFDPDRDMRGSGAVAGAYETHQAVRHYGYNHKKADLLVSNKDGGEFAHKHWYTFVNTMIPSGEIDSDGKPIMKLDVPNSSITLHMGNATNWDEVGLLDYDDVRELMAYISDGSNYTVEMLAALWKVEKNTATELLAKLIQQDQLVSKKYGYGLP